MGKILVKPLGDGWAVETPSTDNPMVFRSGRAAEDAGKRLARRLAEAGATIELELRLRSGICAARLLCVPPAHEKDDILLLGLPGLSNEGVAALAHEPTGNP